jgi:hypothetical protein
MQWFSKLKSGGELGGFGNALGNLVAQAASLIPEEFKDNDDHDADDPTYVEPTSELIEYVSHLAQHPSTFTEFPIPRAPGTSPSTSVLHVLLNQWGGFVIVRGRVSLVPRSSTPCTQNAGDGARLAEAALLHVPQ